MSDNQVVADFPALSEKTEKVSIQFEGEEFLKFRHLSDRLTFGKKMNDKKTKESVLSLALNCLYLMTDKLSKSGHVFIPADAEKIVSEANKPEVDYEAKFNALKKELEKLKPEEDGGPVIIKAAAFARIAGQLIE